MPLLVDGNRFLVDQLANRINEVVFGFDGTVATTEDGGVGRPAFVAVPKVRIVDDHSIFVEATLPLEQSFTLPLREICLQYKNPNDATDTTALFRYTFQSVNKSEDNELRFSTIIEVN